MPSCCVSCALAHRPIMGSNAGRSVELQVFISGKDVRSNPFGLFDSPWSCAVVSVSMSTRKGRVYTKYGSVHSWFIVCACLFLSLPLLWMRVEMFTCPAVRGSWCQDGGFERFVCCFTSRNLHLLRNPRNSCCGVVPFVLHFSLIAATRLLIYTANHAGANATIVPKMKDLGRCLPLLTAPLQENRLGWVHQLWTFVLQHEDARTDVCFGSWTSSVRYACLLCQHTKIYSGHVSSPWEDADLFYPTERGLRYFPAEDCTSNHNGKSLTLLQCPRGASQ